MAKNKTQPTTSSKSAHDQASLISKLLCWWVTGFLSANYGKPFGVKDLGVCSKNDISSDLGRKLDKNWRKELDESVSHGREPSLFRAVTRTFGLFYSLLGLDLVLVQCFLRVVQTISLGLMVRYVKDYKQMSEEEIENDSITNPWNSTLYWIYYSAGTICVTSTLSVLFTHPYYLATFRIGMKLRVAACHLIYRKSLRLSARAMRETTVGQIVNLLSNDVNRFDWCLVYTHHLIVGPLHVVLSVIILYWYMEIGVACLASVAVLFLYAPFQALMGKLFSKLRSKTALLTDERVRLMNEIFPAMRVIKMYTWEKPFAALVQLARRNEVEIIKKTAILRGINLALYYVSSKVITFITLVLFVLLGGELNAENVFVAISLIDQMRLSMTLYFPYGISMGAEALISLSRIQAFLLLPEAEETEMLDKTNLRKQATESDISVMVEEDDSDTESVDLGTASTSSRNKISSRPHIMMNKATAGWSQPPKSGSQIEIKAIDSKQAIISNLSFTASVGKLTVIIGPVGSGKSSVLMSILGELPVISGHVRVRGKIAYASQEAWTFAGTVRENITFGCKYDERKYKQVVHVAALERDMEQFPYGDRTMIGDRGVSLSGGQRARINLARALYSDADIYLLDDPLSAVDSAVAKHIFEKCIRGYLKDKVVILVTHQLQFIKAAEQIIVLQDGAALAVGDYMDLLREGINFVRLAGDSHDGKEPEIVPGLKNLIRQQSSVGSTSADFFGGSRLSVSSVVTNLAENEQTENLGEKDGPRKEEDEMANSESASSAIYWIYMKAGVGTFLLLAVFLFNIITQVIFTGSEYWLSLWTNYQEQYHLYVKDLQKYNKTIDGSTNITKEPVEPNPGDFIFSQEESGWNMIIYTILVSILFVFSLIKTTSFFTICMNASINLHNKLFASVIRAPISFFDSNPIGRLLNRCSRDLGIIDDLIPITAFDMVEIMLNCLSIAILCVIIDYWSIIPVAVLLIILSFIRKFYIGTARRLKKVEGVARSPLFTHLSTSLFGITTIRAFDMQPTFETKFDELQDVHTSSWFLFLCSSRWFGIVLDLLCCVYFVVITLSLALNLDNKTASEIGLAISQALTICNSFQWGVRQWAELESQMTSVERIDEYSHIEKESAFDDDDLRSRPPQDWPSSGQIVYKDVSMTYSESEPPVLKMLNFEIEPAEKIGIVGRTGAGKSSIIASLFRMNEHGLSGLISIDGVDTSSIGLSHLRRKISIIPQEPILFTGSVKRNIDPFNEKSDERLWQVLERVQLKSAIQSLSGKLDDLISEGGGNFSVGQRQLICLARAVLRENKILVLDEATANVDPKTDLLIQQTIREEFSSCTVLTIAHRLHTIMDSSRVLVLDAGRVMEFDTPFNLLANRDGIFYDMVETTGKDMKEHLREIARLAHEVRTGIANNLDLIVKRNRMDSLRESISSCVRSGSTGIVIQEESEKAIPKN